MKAHAGRIRITIRTLSFSSETTENIAEGCHQACKRAMEERGLSPENADILVEVRVDGFQAPEVRL